MKTKFLVILYILLLCPMGSFAINMPRYVPPVVHTDTFVLQTHGCQVSAPAPIYDCHTADEAYQVRMRTYLASDPYGDNTTPQMVVVRHASRPGGGTGVIPNPTPLQDALWLLVLMAAGYLLYIRIRRTRSQSEDKV